MIDITIWKICRKVLKNENSSKEHIYKLHPKEFEIAGNFRDLLEKDTSMFSSIVVKKYNKEK